MSVAIFISVGIVALNIKSEEDKIMIKLLIGKKGSGKTKTLIEATNAASVEANGNVVFISDDTRRSMHDIKSKVRMADTKDFAVCSYSEFYGFICGIISRDYDITNVFIDGIFKIIGTDNLDGFEQFLAKLETVSKELNVAFEISVSIDADTAPDYIKALA